LRHKAVEVGLNDAGADAVEGLEQTALGEAQDSLMADHKVVQYPHVNQPQRLA